MAEEEIIMCQKDMDKLQEAISIIFEVEQRWRKGRYDYAADTLYKSRIEINNARSRGQRTKFPEKRKSNLIRKDNTE